MTPTTSHDTTTTTSTDEKEQRRRLRHTIPSLDISAAEIMELPYMTLPMACVVLQWTPAQMWAHNNRGTGPHYSRLGKSCRYTPESIKAFVEKHDHRLLKNV